MSKEVKIPGTPEAWESGMLGEDQEFVKTTDKAMACQIDEALGLQPISIRLDKGLIDSFKMLASFHGVGYQPLMRDALKRFAEHEMKAIVSGLVESQRKDKGNNPIEPNGCEHKKAA